MTKAFYLVSLVSSCLTFAALPSTVARAERPSVEDQAFFEKKIRPVLVDHCYACHAAGAEELGGKLLLDRRDGLLQGGESGPAVVAGKPDESLIIQALRYEGLEMPPEQPLPEHVVNDFVKWVQRGAPDPRSPDSRADDPPQAKADAKNASIDADELWSFRPRQDPAPPQVRNAAWPRDPLDRFILARIEQAGLTPTRDADPRTLARRLYYDLIGLSPTLQQIEAFMAEYATDGPRAVERLVDSLLGQSAFGERWGRHWLDVARYAESNGDDGLGRNATFPHAWRYRDYVIDALNRDLPYDRFVTEQIAGDLLPAESAEQRNRQLTATGFLAIGAKPASAMNKNFAMDVVDDQIDVVSTAVMGLSVACARCHDHKHDPIPTSDYYALAGMFASTETLYGLAANEKLTAPPTGLHELNSVWQPGSTGTTDPDAVPAFSAGYGQAIDELQPHLHAVLDVAPEGLTIESGAKFSPESFAAVDSAMIQGELPSGDDSYSVSLWFKNETKNNARPITAYLFSRAEAGDKALPGDHLGIGGTHDKARTGKLFVYSGGAVKQSLAGRTVIASGTWNHVVLIRRGNRVQVFLNGGPEPEIDGELAAGQGDSRSFCLGSRSDHFAPLAGNLAEFAIFPRALEAGEAQRLHAASGQPRGARTLGLAMGVRDKPKPADCKIHINGESGKFGPSVPRGFLTAYRTAVEPAEASAEASSAADFADAEFPIGANESGRLQLARWLTRPDHPQTARVMVNRIWLHLFGRGIVATPDDFGVYGARPSHPELLDHLAERFVREGWSVKRMIRGIVLSRTYQLDSRSEESLVRADPDNRLLARHARRRLDAESLRDSMLQASGRLDPTPGEGSAIEELDILINWPPGEATNLHRPSNHRSVYLCMLRHAPPAELAAFDLPDGVGVTGRRDVTTLPTHGLFLLNSPFVVEQAEALARQLLELPEADDAGRVRAAFERTLRRNPSESETQQALRQVRSVQDALRRATPPPAEQQPVARQQAVSDELAEAGPTEDSGEPGPALEDDVRLKSWASLCQALLATNEFRYVD